LRLRSLIFVLIKTLEKRGHADRGDEVAIWAAASVAVFFAMIGTILVLQPLAVAANARSGA